MKKLITILTLSILLSACGNVTTTISNRNENVFTVGNQSVTWGQIYSVMLLSDPSGVVRTMALEIILNQEIEVTPEMETKADEELANFLESVGESIDMYLSYFGFKDIEDFRRNSILLEIQKEALMLKYFEANLEDVLTRFRPRKVRIMEVIDPETAELALSEIRAGADFQTVTELYGSPQFGGDETLINSNTQLPFIVREFINFQTVPTLSDVIPAGTTNYLVQVTVADPNKMLDEVRENLIRDNTFIELVIEHYMRANNFTIFDRTVFDLFIQQFPNYLGN